MTRLVCAWVLVNAVLLGQRERHMVTLLAVEIDLRVVAPFWRLLRRGYVRLLLAGGPKVLAFGARHGVGDLAALRRLVAAQRSDEPATWETGAGSAR